VATLTLTLPLARPGPELLRHDLRAPAALTTAAAIHRLEAPGDAFSALAVPEQVRAQSRREFVLGARCAAQRSDWELLRAASDDGPTACPLVTGSVQRLLNAWV